MTDELTKWKIAFWVIVVLFIGYMFLIGYLSEDYSYLKVFRN